MANTLLSSIVAPSGVVTVTGTQTLSNKTITNLILAGTLSAGGSVGTSGQVLQSTGTGVQWTSGGTGSVTSVSLSGGTTGLTTSGGPITTSGTITLSGTLAVANGGTGVTTSTGSGSNVLSTSPTLVTPVLGAATATSVTIGTLTYTAANALFTAQSSATSYNQVIIQNSNTGTTASTDFIVNNSNSTDSTYYGDFGMNSSGFTGSGAFNQPNNVYLTSTTADLAIGTTTSNAIHFVINGGATDAMTIGTTGTVTVAGSTQTASFGVGTAADGTSGNIRATGQITAYYSDDRLKVRGPNIPNALEKVLSLNGFYYHANETAQQLGYSVKMEIGVSAQEVQNVLSEVVEPAPVDDKYLTVHYERLIPLLIEAIKEQQKQIEELKEKLG